LKDLFAERQCYIFLASEDHVDPNGETLVTKPMGWYGAPSGSAGERRPLPLASEPHCQFSKSMIKALDRAGLPWEMALDSESTRTVEAVVAADLAVFAQIEGTNAPQLEEISHGGHCQKWARN
jgi:hypothetical protein